MRKTRTCDSLSVPTVIRFNPIPIGVSLDTVRRWEGLGALPLPHPIVWGDMYYMSNYWEILGPLTVSDSRRNERSINIT